MTEQDAEQSDKLRDYARDFIFGGLNDLTNLI